MNGSVDTVTYPYSRTHPAANPAHYMYAAYGGHEFLADYRRDRESLLELVPHRRDAAVPAPSGRVALPVLPSHIDTLDTLGACIACPRDAPGRAPLVKLFVRKIEITRRLRSAYTADGRAAGGEAPLAAYVLTADLLATEVLASVAHAKLRLLNALLKTVDILSYRRAELAGEPLAFAARRPITIEVTAIGQLARELGIDPRP